MHVIPHPTSLLFIWPLLGGQLAVALSIAVAVCWRHGATASSNSSLNNFHKTKFLRICVDVGRLHAGACRCLSTMLKEINFDWSKQPYLSWIRMSVSWRIGYPPFYEENPFGIYQKADSKIFRSQFAKHNPPGIRSLHFVQVLQGHLDFPRHFDVKAKAWCSWFFLQCRRSLQVCSLSIWIYSMVFDLNTIDRTSHWQDLVRRLLVADRTKRFGCLKQIPQRASEGFWCTRFDGSFDNFSLLQGWGWRYQAAQVVQGPTSFVFAGVSPDGIQ